MLAAAAAVFPRALRADGPLWEKSFSVMDPWFWSEKDLDAAAQAALLKKLGYSGMALTWGQKHAERMHALREAGLEAPALFLTADLEGSGVPQDVIDFLKGTSTSVWLALSSRKHKKSDPAGDDSAAGLLAKWSDACREAALPGVALYPHAGLWAEKIGDAVRVADRVGRADVGVVFNQYHWMATEPGEDPGKALASIGSRLRAVTINGSAKRASILPLSEGEYDPLPILKALVELNYLGPVSLQGFGIRGNLAERLEASIKKWEELKRNARKTAAGPARAHLFISGVVQGVSFRASTQEQAKRLGVAGWVRNLDDGRVEAVVQGPKDKVDELVQWCHKGPPAARVDKVSVAWETVADDLKGFEVRY